jgi:hypothetical protein
LELLCNWFNLFIFFFCMCEKDGYYMVVVCHRVRLHPWEILCGDELSSTWGPMALWPGGPSYWPNQKICWFLLHCCVLFLFLLIRRILDLKRVKIWANLCFAWISATNRCDLFLLFSSCFFSSLSYLFVKLQYCLLLLKHELSKTFLQVK